MRIPVHRRRKQAALIFSATPSIIWLRGLTLFFALASPIPKFRRVTRIVLLNKRRLAENAMGQFGWLNPWNPVRLLTTNGLGTVLFGIMFKC